MGVFFLTEALILFTRDALVWDFVHFVLYISKTKSNLSMFWAMFDILSVSSASQRSPYVLERLGRFILTNAAPSTSLTLTSRGSSEGSITTDKQAYKSNFVLRFRKFPYSEMEIE